MLIGLAASIFHHPIEGPLLLAWSWDPAVLFGLGVTAGVYLAGVWQLWRRGRAKGYRARAGLFFLGLFAILVALQSPIDALADNMFTFHMVQHLLLIMVGAPLVLLGAPAVLTLWATPPRIARATVKPFASNQVIRRSFAMLTNPVVAWLAFAVNLWLWHAPTWYGAALENERIHILQHLCFLGTALLFWWPAIGPTVGKHGLPHPARILYLFTAMLQDMFLGVVITFSKGILYPYYESGSRLWGLSPFEDQQIGGLIMWIPGGMVYFIAMSILFFAWLEREERSATREEAYRRND